MFKVTVANKFTSILSNILWIVLGILALVSPSAFGSSLGILAGSFMIVIGVLFVLFALFSSSLLVGTGFLVLQGIVTLVLGLFLVIYREASLMMITFALAFYFLFNGLTKLITSVDLYKLKSKTWWVTTIFGSLYVALSIVLFMFNDDGANIISYIIGAFFVLSGIFGFLELFNTYKREKREQVIINNIRKNVNNIDHVDIDFTNDN